MSLKTFKIPYGNGVQEVDLPEEKILYDIHGNKAEIKEDLAAETLRALRDPIDSKPLSQLVEKGDKIAIVVSDLTRMVRTKEFLPVILGELNVNGIPDEDICIVVGTGTHRGHTPEENIIVYGADVCKRVAIYQHDCLAADLVPMGVTSRGTPILINKHVATADKVIVTGGITLHPMAGFGGGRKGIMPGVSGHATIMANHAHALADKVGDRCNPACVAGILDNNPFHEDMEEACSVLNPTFLVNVVFTPDGDLFEVAAGHWKNAWLKGCKDLLEISKVDIDQQADVVIASAGGSPKDTNLYQGTKAHMNADFALKKGGILIVALECPDIKEPAIFSEWCSKSDLLQMEKECRANFSIPAFVAFKTRCIIQDCTAYMVTLPENFAYVRQTGQIPVATVAQAWKLAQEKLKEQGKEDYKIIFMGHASSTLPVLKV